MISGIYAGQLLTVKARPAPTRSRPRFKLSLQVPCPCHCERPVLCHRECPALVIASALSFVIASALPLSLRAPCPLSSRVPCPCHCERPVLCHCKCPTLVIASEARQSRCRRTCAGLPQVRVMIRPYPHLRRRFWITPPDPDPFSMEAIPLLRSVTENAYRVDESRNARRPAIGGFPSNDTRCTPR